MATVKLLLMQARQHEGGDQHQRGHAQIDAFAQLTARSMFSEARLQPLKGRLENEIQGRTAIGGVKKTLGKAKSDHVAQSNRLLSCHRRNSVRGVGMD